MIKYLFVENRKENIRMKGIKSQQNKSGTTRVLVTLKLSHLFAIELDKMA